jgi:hypothetical protein
MSDVRRLDEIKEVFVPNVHLDDTPATGKSLGRRREALPSTLFRDELPNIELNEIVVSVLAETMPAVTVPPRP